MRGRPANEGSEDLLERSVGGKGLIAKNVSEACHSSGRCRLVTLRMPHCVDVVGDGLKKVVESVRTTAICLAVSYITDN